MPDPVSLSANPPIRRYFRLGEEDGIRQEFNGTLPHEEVRNTGRRLEGVSSAKTLFVGMLPHKLGNSPWVVRSCEGQSQEAIKGGLSEIAARAIMSEILGTTDGLVIPEAYAYEMPDNKHLAVRYVDGMSRVEEDTGLLRLLSPAIKAKIALCIIAEGMKEFPVSSILVDEKTSQAALLDFESMTLPEGGKSVVPSFSSSTKLTLSLLRTMVPQNKDSIISEKELSDKYIGEVKQCLLAWKTRITTEQPLREKLTDLIHIETGLPKSSSNDSELSANKIVDNLIYIVHNLDKEDLPTSYQSLISDEATGNNTEVFNETEAEKKLGRAAGMLPELIEVFYAEAPKNIADLEKGINTGDVALFKRAAHTLKGSAMCFAAKDLIQAAEELETMGRDGNLEGADKKLEVLKQKLEALLKALGAYKDKKSS